MKYWPVPKSYSKNIPQNNKPGSFWKNRLDRFHCGVDIYAPKLSKVLSIESGEVIDSGIFTSPMDVYYWNTTYFVDIKNNDNVYFRYAELNNTTVKKGDIVDAGDIIGFVGQVLNKSKIDDKSPQYIRDLKNKDNLSMLHFELYIGSPKLSKKYLGGNWFEEKKPNNLLNPTEFLQSIL